VLETEYTDTGVAVKAACPAHIYGRIKEYVVN